MSNRRMKNLRRRNAEENHRREAEVRRIRSEGAKAQYALEGAMIQVKDVEQLYKAAIRDLRLEKGRIMKLLDSIGKVAPVRGSYEDHGQRCRTFQARTPDGQWHAIFSVGEREWKENPIGLGQLAETEVRYLYWMQLLAIAAERFAGLRVPPGSQLSRYESVPQPNGVVFERMPKLIASWDPGTASSIMDMHYTKEKGEGL